MIFEIGKYYQHTNGSRLFICGAVVSHIYGTGIVAEDEYGKFSRVGEGEDNATNFHEITKEQFMSPSESNRMNQCECNCAQKPDKVDGDEEKIKHILNELRNYIQYISYGLSAENAKDALQSKNFDDALVICVRRGITTEGIY